MTEYARGNDTLAVDDADELRAQLDVLNDAGIDYRLSGIDARQQPFLAQLAGVYAENVDVILGSPWDSEVDYGTGTRCEECSAQNHHGLEQLTYPVTVIGVLVPALDGVES